MNFDIYIKKLKYVYLWLTLSFVIFIVWQHSLDIESTITLLPKLSAGLVIQCLSLTMLSYSFRSFRWLGYIRLIERRTSIYRHIIIYFSSFAFTASPGKTGELMRGMYLSGLGIPFRYTLLSFLSERLFDIITVLFLSTYFLINHFNNAFVLLSGCMLLFPFIISPLFSIALKLSQKEIWLDSLRILVKFWGIAIILKHQFLTLLTWSAQGLILLLILQGFGVEVSIIMAISIYCLSLLIGAISMIPSGIGVTEIGMIWLLTRIGVDNDIGVIASVITRILTLWPAIVTGLVCAFILRKN